MFRVGVWDVVIFVYLWCMKCVCCQLNWVVFFCIVCSFVMFIMGAICDQIVETYSSISRGKSSRRSSIVETWFVDTIILRRNVLDAWAPNKGEGRWLGNQNLWGIPKVFVHKSSIHIVINCINIINIIQTWQLTLILTTYFDAYMIESRWCRVKPKPVTGGCNAGTSGDWCWCTCTKSQHNTNANNSHTHTTQATTNQTKLTKT